MNLRQQLKTIAMKEFRGFVNSPWAYVIMVPFLLITHFLFFRTALVLGDANLRPLIELLPWFLMVIGPALAMRSFSDEQKKGTTELLLAHPVSEWTIVLGKFLGLWGFYALMLGATLVLPLILGIFSTPDWGMMAGQYWGAFLTGTTFLAVGMATSALMGNAIGGFLLGVAVNFVLMITGMGMILLMLPGLVGRFVAELSLLSHLTNFSRGVIDLRDGLYFFTITVIAATLTTLKLTERKVAESRKERNKLGVIILIVLGIGIIGNLLLYEFPLRLDLTADKRYSLSRGTKELLKTLPDRVTITLYTSDNLPGPTQVVLRQTSDVLGDFEGRSKRIQIRKVTVSTQDMSQRMEVQQKGIQEIQFNQIANSGFQVQTGYLGLEIRYGDKTEVIPYVSDATNLEYDLARKILRLTKENLGKIGLINVAESESRSA